MLVELPVHIFTEKVDNVEFSDKMHELGIDQGIERTELIDYCLINTDHIEMVIAVDNESKIGFASGAECYVNIPYQDLKKILTNWAK